MSKYFAISFFCHAALFALLFSESMKADRGETRSFDQDNILIELVPFIQSTVTPDNLAPHKSTFHRRKTDLSSAEHKNFNLNSTLIDKTQNITVQPYDKNLTVIKTTDVVIRPEANQKKRKIESATPIFDPPATKQFLGMQTLNFSMTEMSNMTEAEAAPFRETLTPTPKPKAKANLETENLAKKSRVETDNSPKPIYPVKKILRAQNNSRAKVTSEAILKFNKEFATQPNATKNAQFSTRTMPKQNSNISFMSSHPRLNRDLAKRQCKLISRQETRSQANIREIQKQIQARGITISNILTYRSHQKINEITISGLLASELNTLSHNQRRARDNIGFLLTTSNFQDYAKDLVCKPY